MFNTAISLLQRNLLSYNLLQLNFWNPFPFEGTTLKILRVFYENIIGSMLKTIPLLLEIFFSEITVIKSYYYMKRRDLHTISRLIYTSKN